MGNQKVLNYSGLNYESLSTIITIRSFPWAWHWKGWDAPGLDLGVEAHGETVEDVGENHEGCLVPGDHRVGNSAEQDDDTEEITETISEIITDQLIPPRLGKEIELFTKKLI